MIKQNSYSNDVIKCMIVDDEPLAIQLIEDYVDKIPRLNRIASCQNGMEAFELLKKESVELIFLDIEMPVLTGIDLVKSLQSPPAIIFTTANRNYAVESYELNVVDYLVKPIEFSRFFIAVNKFIGQLNQKEIKITNQETTINHYLYVNSNKKHIKVEFKQILYIESIKDYIRIHTLDNTITTKNKISLFEKKLPTYFLRVHRSFIVNTQKITAFTKQDVEINQREIPIGRSYKEMIFKLLG